ncbi:MAG TPA: DUF4129 domain-containing protein [Candidatus Dormibacteraeota bacterium]|nr:DUF4129 domain-containing protein [Candidatus Dormibacteraeota bacterium]
MEPVEMMGAKRSAGTLILAGALLALAGALVGLGSAAPPGTMAPPPPTPVAVAIEAVSYLALALEGMVLGLIVRALWPGRRGRRAAEDEPTVAPLPMSPLLRLALTVLPLLTVAAGVWAVLHLRPAHPASPRPGGMVALPAALQGAPGAVAAGDAAWIALGLAMLILAGAAIVVLRRHRPRATAGGERRARAVAAAVDEGLEALDREPDPRRAVILAYAAMERTLSGRGWPRHPWEAPFEYLDRVLRETEVGRFSLHRLTDLFEVARYSHHRIDERMRAAALAELRSLRSELEVRPSSA